MDPDHRKAIGRAFIFRLARTGIREDEGDRFSGGRSRDGIPNPRGSTPINGDIAE
jgi:hypothetical protein